MVTHDHARLPWDADLARYDAQAASLLEAFRRGEQEAIDGVRALHPRFRRADVVWLARDVSDHEVRDAGLELDDARLVVARWYDFDTWEHLAEHVQAVMDTNSPIRRFEAAVEAVVDGDVASLASLLDAHPQLVAARSNRITHFDPPRHRATLLHYIAANGVEGYRQRTPDNAVDVARLLLERGAEVDSLADLYGGQCTTMTLLVSSTHPAQAGLQVALVETLVDCGAAVEPKGSGSWTSPLMTALTFGYVDAANALVRRGARVESLSAAAGLGLVEAARQFLAGADALDRHRALALSAQNGHAEIVRLLLDAGEDPNRYNPPGHHAHATPLHHAALHGHEAVVRLLVDRGARLDVKDTIYDGTPTGWAFHGGHRDIADYLHARS